MSGAGIPIAVGSNEFFRRIAEDAPRAIAVLDVEQRPRVLYANTVMAALTGYEDEALAGLAAAELIEPADRETFQTRLRSVVAGHAARLELELRLVAANANVLWVLLSASVLRDVRGRALYVIVHMHDIDARKALDTTIAYNAAHDPLTDLYQPAQLRRAADTPPGARAPLRRWRRDRAAGRRPPQADQRRPRAW